MEKKGLQIKMVVKKNLPSNILASLVKGNSDKELDLSDLEHDVASCPWGIPNALCVVGIQNFELHENALLGS